MRHLPVILPWSSEQYVAHVHWHDITDHCIVVLANAELHLTLFIDQQLVAFLQPRHLVRSGVLQPLQTQLLYHLGGNQIIRAPTVDNQLATFSMRLANCPK